MDSGNVLIVDDEVNILKALSREFIMRDIGFFTANSAEEALKIFENIEIDIVLSDVKMPSMNGLEFLSIVKEKYPRTARIILSGYVDNNLMVEALSRGLAFTFFSKPWNTENLMSKIEHILKIKQLLRSSLITKTINSIANLPVIPEMYAKILKLIEDDAPANKISELIELNPSISAKIMQIANSVFYSSKEVLCIRDAVIRLGFDIIKNIVLILSMSENSNVSENEIHEIFRHSILVDKYFKEVYRRILNEEIPDKLSSIGILHDIGKLIILSFFPDRYLETKECMIKYPELNFYEAEVKLGLGCQTHSELGGYFADLWNFPEHIIEIIIFHHIPEYIVSDELKETVIYFKAADLLAERVYKREDEKIKQNLKELLNEEVYEKIINDEILWK